jgi:hypothetical protein
MRFIRFRPVACRQCFFDIAKPSRAMSRPFFRASTVNHLSLLRVAFLNTRPNASALSSRFSLWSL